MIISKKNIKIGLAVGIAAVLSCAGGAASLAVQAAELTQSSASLFLPTSYEQYLELEEPSVAAFSEGYFAIADGDTLYIYDREAESYSETALPDGESVTQLGFAGDRLFVSTRSASNYFYEFDFSERKLVKLSINFSTFCINGNTLYTANVGGQQTTIASYSIEDLGTEKDLSPTNLGTLKNNATPSMTFLDGTLYCVFGYVVYYQNDKDQFDDNTCFFLSKNAPDVTQVRSVCAVEGYFYYTSKDGLYRTDIASNSELIVQGEGFSALTAYDDKLYVIQGSSIKELALTEGGAEFTGYEIASASSSVNRLDGAVDTARAGNLLVTADAGNKRVTVYDFSTGKYSKIGGGEDFSPTHVATDGTMIAAVSENTIYTCTYSAETEMQFTAADESVTSTIHGIACVYGAVYYVTGNAYGKLGGDEVFHDGYGSPAALTADVYGDLFVVYGSSREVVRFTEKEFCDAEAEGEKLGYPLPEGFKSLRADFKGNLYYLVGDALKRNYGEEIASVRGSDYVYTMSEDAPSAFALGYEDDEVYFLFGEYIVGTARGALDIPTLGEIDAEGVGEEIFAPHGKENLFVDIPAGTVGFRTSLGALREEEPEYFPYEFYFRTSEDARGVLLAEKNGFALVVLYEIGENDRKFTAALFHIAPETDGLIVQEEAYWTEKGSTMYLTSEVSAYFFPCLSSALADSTIPRGAKVTVVGTVHAPEQHDYALVEYETPARARARGYVPVGCLTDVDPNFTAEDKYLFGSLKKSDAEEGYAFVSDDGGVIHLHGGERVRLEDNGDGTYTARYTAEDGKTYSAVVAKGNIDWGESDALRISLIVILSVVAVLIVALYVWFLPRKPKELRK